MKTPPKKIIFGLKVTRLDGTSLYAQGHFKKNYLRKDRHSSKYPMYFYPFGNHPLNEANTRLHDVYDPKKTPQVRVFLIMAENPCKISNADLTSPDDLTSFGTVSENAIREYWKLGTQSVYGAEHSGSKKITILAELFGTYEQLSEYLRTH